MQPVTFKCGHCGNLMAVGDEFLGRQVRCPHCQQVVVAPPAPQPAAAHAAPAPPPNGADDTALLPAAGDPADIFTDDHTEDIFGGPPPRLELPPPDRDPTVPLDAAPPEAPPDGHTPTPAEAPALGPEVPDWMKESAPRAPLTPAAAPRRGMSVAMLLFVSLVFMPLVLYSVLVTVVAVLVYQRAPDPPRDPRENLQDIPASDHPGFKKVKTTGGGLPTTMQFATLPLPDSLRIKVGETLTLGDLSVQAGGVEHCEVRMRTPGFNKPDTIETIKLRLHLKNLSRDAAFYPMDCYFDRKWREGPRSGPPPLTVLLAGEDLRLFGGPAVWNRGPQGPEDNPERRNYVVDNHYDTELKPGEEMDTFVCVDGNGPKWEELLAYKGKMVWHVHVRRGVVPWKGHDYPATAVFGVEFTDADIKQPD
jgi:hypothetical protein